MSNLIPPLLSSSPPPIVGPLDEDDDDEFGDFRAAADSYGCDDFSLPPSPQISPEKELKSDLTKVNLDINCNNSERCGNSHEILFTEEINKDFQDRRKSLEFEVNFSSREANCEQADKVSNSENDQDTEVSIEDPEQPQLNSNSLENVFDAFGESIPEKSSDEISELNEINPDNFMEDDVEKNFVKDLSECSISLKDDPSDDDFGDFANFETTKAGQEFDEFEEPQNIDNLEPTEDDFGDFESSDFTSTRVPVVLEINEKNCLQKSEVILNEIFPKTQTEIDEFNFFDDTKENRIFDELKDVTETNALIYQWSKSNSQKMLFKALNIDTRNILYGPAWNGSMSRFATNLSLAPLEPIKPEILTPTPVLTSSPSISSQKSTDIPTAQFDWNGSGLINPLDYSQTMLLDLEQLVASLDIPSTTNSNYSPTPSNDLLDEWDFWLQSTSNESPGCVPVDSQPASDFLPPKSESVTNLFIETSTKSETEPKMPKSELSSPKLIPLRETHISNDLSNDLNKPVWLQPTILTPDLPRKTVSSEQDDEFDDFQMVLPEQDDNNKKSNQKHIYENEQSGPKNELEDDEFTEFHSSLPPGIPTQPLQPISLEPLKPIVQYNASPMNLINWPDPGVSDEEIRKIELSYSRKNDEKKQENEDDDEWSDFVSVINPVKTERTATPDLPLSVLNLNNVQAPKQPIPVITPNGLIQTKLSSNLTSVVQTSVQQNLYKPVSHNQPSIISNQFAANFFPNSTATQDDDDDWSDFVSGQPPQQVNGFQKNLKLATTNIIMNPTHEAFDFKTQKKVQSTRHQIPSISSIPDLDFIAPKNRTSKK